MKILTQDSIFKLNVATQSIGLVFCIHCNANIDRGFLCNKWICCTVSYYICIALLTLHINRGHVLLLFFFIGGHTFSKREESWSALNGFAHCLVDNLLYDFLGRFVTWISLRAICDLFFWDNLLPNFFGGDNLSPEFGTIRQLFAAACSHLQGIREQRILMQLSILIWGWGSPLG